MLMLIFMCMLVIVIMVVFVVMLVFVVMIVFTIDQGDRIDAVRCIDDDQLVVRHRLDGTLSPWLHRQSVQHEQVSVLQYQKILGPRLKSMCTGPCRNE